MLFKNHYIKINNHNINLAQHPNVFYRASKQDRDKAIKTIISSATNSRIFIVSEGKIPDATNVFWQDPKKINEYGRYIRHDIERWYSFFQTVNPPVKTMDELVEALNDKKCEKYTLVIINDANKYKAYDFLNGMLIALQKGRAVGYHMILMDEDFKKDLMVMANITCKINDKGENYK